MKKNKVSVVIPSYNRKEKLRLTIKSLIESELKPDEIIVVDDGSIDGTDKMIKEFSGIKYLMQENKGPAAARNRGSFIAQGEYILFIDSDCMVDKKCLNNLISEIEKNENIAVIGCQIKGIIKGFFAKCHDYAHFYDFMLSQKSKRRYLCSSGFMTRKSIFNLVGGFNEKLRVSEDDDFGLRVFEKGYDLIYLSEAIVHHNHDRNTFKDFLALPYSWAKQGSVEPFLQYQHSRYAKFALKNPWYYLLLAPLISFLITAKIVIRIFLIDWKIIIYSPFIFLNKIMWCLGTFNYLRFKI